MSMDFVYPEKVGNRCRGAPAPPPDWPETCPATDGACDAPLVESSDWGAEYECGGSYDRKPQIQNHTEKFWGHCGRGDE